MTRQWTVKVDGNNVKTLHDGESVEIGRKPLRPLSDDGFARLDIMDPGKSMSKRHAAHRLDDPAVRRRASYARIRIRTR